MAAASQGDSNHNETISSLVFGLIQLEPYVYSHLINVYDCLTLGMLFAACGIYVHLVSNIGEWYMVCTAAAVVFALFVVLTFHSDENVAQRMGAFNAFTFFSGVSSGPLIELAVRIDPSIVSTAVSTSVAFVSSLTLAALSSSDRRLASMGVLLYTLFFLLIFVEFANTYIGSRIIFEMYLYSSLVLFSFFVMYDTQLIVEKRIMGKIDFVWHCVTLFLDGFQIFKLILILLANRKSSQNSAQDL